MAHTIVMADLLGGFGINTLAFISQLISFGVVFLILWRWGFPAIIRTLDKRQQVIREGVENAERAKSDLAEATANAQKILQDASRQAQERIAQAVKAGEAERDRIIEEAHTQAEQVSKQNIERIRQEAARAQADISRMVVNLSINAAERVIGKSVDSNDNRRFVEEFVTASANQAREE